MKPLPISILYEHADFIAVDKPPGLSVQNEQDTSGILPLLCAQLGVEKLWLVHRLDKVTSGVLLLGKNQRAASKLSQLFARRLTEKYYLAISHKKPSKKQGTVCGDMQKSRGGQWMLTQSQENPAVTQFFSKGLGQGQRLFLLKPVTGKTHQIRVAMKSLGSPILGDPLYKGHTADRTYLHAYSLSFAYDDDEVRIQSPLTVGNIFCSADCQDVLSALLPAEQQPWPRLNPALLNKINKLNAKEEDLD